MTARRQRRAAQSTQSAAHSVSQAPPDVTLDLNHFLRTLRESSQLSPLSAAFRAMNTLPRLPSKIARLTILTGYSADGYCACCPDGIEDHEAAAGQLLRSQLDKSDIQEAVIHYHNPEAHRYHRIGEAMLHCRMPFNVNAEMTLQTTGSKGSNNPGTFYSHATAKNRRAAADGREQSQRVAVGSILGDETSTRDLENVMSEFNQDNEGVEV